jgi:hypothetical protein
MHIIAVMKLRARHKRGNKLSKSKRNKRKERELTAVLEVCECRMFLGNDLGTDPRP